MTVLTSCVSICLYSGDTGTVPVYSCKVITKCLMVAELWNNSSLIILGLSPWQVINSLRWWPESGRLPLAQDYVSHGAVHWHTHCCTMEPPVRYGNAHTHTHTGQKPGSLQSVCNVYRIFLLWLHEEWYWVALPCVSTHAHTQSLKKTTWLASPPPSSCSLRRLTPWPRCRRQSEPIRRLPGF